MTNILDDFVKKMFRTLTGTEADANIIKRHTSNLEDVGEISFPLLSKCWSAYIDDETDVLVRKFDESDRETTVKELCDSLVYRIFKIRRYKIVKDRAYLYLERQPVYLHAISAVVAQKFDYGRSETLKCVISVKLDGPDTVDDLSALRMSLIKTIVENLLKFVTAKNSDGAKTIVLSQTADGDSILCGAVINDGGVKDTDRSVSDFYDKRIADLRTMSRHRLGVQVSEEHFKKLAEASVALEMLANKPHKCIKIPMDGVNKNSLFVVYNYARLCALLKEFDSRVTRGIYPAIGDVKDIDFDLLDRREEWELVYVYVLQFPAVIESCIGDIESGVINPQHLVTFLINWSSLFSVYYNKCRILVDPRVHLFGLIHARMCLINGLRWVVHNSLRMLGIDPVTQM
ncbi:DALR anticodon-binding domain-containing protein 3 [Cylas formicarius]|uniref:DALR anticodon-binding domain-containing protein 3 n=1 Tax=Cylas formicarius TaxID=197179 RepID=UPI0029583A77|nr:DALR anticodon-binding domain-containing protein 3 [Cylas formicarius]